MHKEGHYVADERLLNLAQAQQVTALVCGGEEQLRCKVLGVGRRLQMIHLLGGKSCRVY